jgi:seryl-tRNA synthetase
MRASADATIALAPPDTAAERAVSALRARGELWESAPGLVGLRGSALALFRALEHALARLAAGDATDGSWRTEEWMVPAALAFETLERARYFESFPQWLTAASHLYDDADTLERVAASDRPADAARVALAPASAALPPAVCYHAYAALAGRTLHAPAFVTAQGTCWRHEGARLRPLARGWAFTMREVVCLGDAGIVTAFADRATARAVAFADSLGLAPRLAEASDPFFAPTARGRALLQRVKALKHELLLPLGGGEEIAAASVNRHERFFGEAFGILLPGGEPASGACAAFGLERWLLAVLAAHGPDPRGWPDVARLDSEEIRP